MHVPRLAVVLCVFVAGTLAQADDLATVIHSCGKPSTITTSLDNGEWIRTAEYRLGGDSVVDVAFGSANRKSPWNFYDARHYGGQGGILENAADLLPCLTSSGVLPLQTQAAAAAPANPPSSDKGTALFGLILIALAVVLYFIPWALAMHRRCKAAEGIAVVNLFLGWTFVGWVVALAWAASGEARAQTAPRRSCSSD